VRLYQEQGSYAVCSSRPHRMPSWILLTLKWAVDSFEGHALCSDNWRTGREILARKRRTKFQVNQKVWDPGSPT
jgi:hypothetical protein